MSCAHVGCEKSKGLRAHRSTPCRGRRPEWLRKYKVKHSAISLLPPRASVHRSEHSRAEMQAAPLASSFLRSELAPWTRIMPSSRSTQPREAPKPADGGIRHGMSRLSTGGQCAQHFVVCSRVHVVSAKLRGHLAAAPIERAAGVAATRHPVHAHARPGQAERGHHVSEQRFALEHRSQRGLKLPQNEGPGLWSIPKFSVQCSSEC